MTALILPKLGMCKSAAEAILELQRMGARQVGSGHFATVWRIETGGYVHQPVSYSGVFYETPSMLVKPTFDWPKERGVRIIKVVQAGHGRGRSGKCDSAGLITAKTAMATCDVDMMAPRYYGITEFGNGEWIAEMEELTPIDTETKAKVTGDSTFRPLDEVVMGSIYMTLLDRHRAAQCSNLHWDIHEANVMMRGKQPVVTDGIYSSEDC